MFYHNAHRASLLPLRVACVAACVFWLHVLSSVQAGAAIDSSNSDARCLTKPSAEVLISAPVEGVLESMRVNQGDSVKVGDVLASLESSREMAAVAHAQVKAGMVATVQAAQVRIEFTKRKVARAQDLIKTAAIGQHELDEAETELRLAEASYAEAVENQRLAHEELHRAQVELALRTIRSPLSGLIVERFLAPGEMVRQGPLLKAVQLHPLHVEVFAPLLWIGRITQGMVVDMTLDLGPHRSYRAQVDMVGQVVDGATSTFIVRLVVPNPDYRIPAGLPCTVGFPTK